MSAEWRQQLKEAEDNLNMKSSQMGRLKVEFDHNLQKLCDSYYPKTRPLKVQTYQSVFNQRWLSLEISWKEKQLEVMEGRSYFDEAAHLDKERKEVLTETALPRFEDSIKALESLTKDDMQVLRKYEQPPELVFLALEATLTLKGEFNVEWEEAKIMLADAYFFGFFIKHAKRFDKDNVPEDIMEKLEKYMSNPDMESTMVAQASIPCGALVKWVRAVYDYARTKQIIGINNFTQAELRGEITRLQEELQMRKEEVAGAEHKLKLLEEEQKQRIKDLKNRYDAAMDPLQETFFEAHHQYGAVACSPRRAN